MPKKCNKNKEVLNSTQIADEDALNKDEICVAKTKELIAIMSSESEEEIEDVEELEGFYPETFISTLEKIFKEAKLISMLKKNKNSLNEKSENNNSNKSESVPVKSVFFNLSTLFIRPKDETSEEKQERKKASKKYKRERVREKELNKRTFKEERKTHQKIAIVNRPNVHGHRLLLAS